MNTVERVVRRLVRVQKVRSQYYTNTIVIIFLTRVINCKIIIIIDFDQISVSQGAGEGEGTQGYRLQDQKGSPQSVSFY